MLNTLDKFDKIVRELIVDEGVNPVAEHVNSSKLFDVLDLSLDKKRNS